MYQDLVDLDNRTHIETAQIDKISFEVKEGDEGERLFAKIGDSEIQVKLPKQFENLCGAFDVPVNFADSMPQDLLASIFKEKGRQQEGRLLNWAIDTVDEEMVAYGDAKKPYIPFSRVGSILEGLGMTDLNGFMGRNGVGEVTGTHEHQGRIEPRVGDITRSGINVHLNPLNNIPPQIAPWSYRLWCSNGMTSLQKKERIKVVGHDVDDVMEQIEFEARRQFEFAEEINHRFADMIDHQVNPVEAMRNLLVSQRIPVRMHDNLLTEAAHLPAENETMYDVMNIYTRFASGQYDTNNRFNLQRIGGDATLAAHLNCRSCGTQLD